MTIFVLMCFDKKNALAERMAVREAHLAYIGLLRLHAPWFASKAAMR